MEHLGSQLLYHLVNPFIIPQGYLSLAYSYILPRYFGGTKIAASPIANMSLLTLLLLIHIHGHYQPGNSQPSWNLRHILSDRIQHHNAVSDDRLSIMPSVSWDQLYCCFDFEKISEEHGEEEEALWLLIYFLIRDSQFFRTFILQQKDVSTLIIRILQHLYKRITSQDELSLDFISILLCILLIFSEDELFHHSIQVMVRLEKKRERFLHFLDDLI
jgi:hypothetical protein